MRIVHLERILEVYEYVVRLFERSMPLLNASPLMRQYLAVFLKRLPLPKLYPQDILLFVWLQSEQAMTED